MFNPYFLSLLTGTFILEDVALVSAISLSSQGKISIYSAFWAIFLGITVGDIAIYFMGYLAPKWPWLMRFKLLKSVESKIKEFGKDTSIAELIVVSRFIPMTRVVTYLLAGISNYSITRFIALTLASVFGWVFLAFAGGMVLVNILKQHWLILAVVLFMLLHFVKKIIAPLFNKWERQILFNSWRKWTDFEFWPAWFFYIPFYFYYAYLSIKHRSFFTPFYINPEVFNGGLLGESKWDFMQHLDPQAPTSLKTIKIAKDTNFLDVKKIFEKNNYQFPIILKPDVGQRGFGVRIVRSFAEIESYLQDAHFDLILQNFSSYVCEAGLFYIRKPGQDKGFVYSITDKRFPYVIGDGQTELGYLIVEDPRARIMLSTYFERLKSELDRVPAKGEKVYISECGNHCQGALFYNGMDLNTPALEKAVNDICLQIPHFYFGRLDVRYKSAEKLKLGLDFEIVEINGAGAEATHIWDPKTKLLDAYKSLFNQWSILFSISATLMRDKNLKHKVFIWDFFKESFKVYFRKGKLSTSS